MTGRVNPPSGATFTGLILGDAEQRVLLMTDAGYGFVATLGDMISKNRNGKALVSVPKGANVMDPVAVPVRDETLYLAAVSNEGRMLVFPLEELPQLAKGKGNKILSIPSARVQNREEYMVAAVVMAATDSITLHAGKRHMTLRFSDLEHYIGERGRRGHKLPRGLQRVDRVTVTQPETRASAAEESGFQSPGNEGPSSE